MPAGSLSAQTIFRKCTNKEAGGEAGRSCMAASSGGFFSLSIPGAAPMFAAVPEGNCDDDAAAVRRLPAWPVLSFGRAHVDRRGDQGFRAKIRPAAVPP